MRIAATLRGVARAIVRGELDESALEGAPRAVALERLTSLPGIGPWSAGLIMLRGLGRLDVFPKGDVGVARGLSNLLGVAEAALDHAVERFGERPGELYFCSLGASLLLRGFIRPPPLSPLGASSRGAYARSMSDAIERALERRLRDRALRADREVEMTPETIERWIREELEGIVRELALARELAGRPPN
jgi:hypothetical protein